MLSDVRKQTNAAVDSLSHLNPLSGQEQDLRNQVITETTTTLQQLASVQTALNVFVERTVAQLNGLVTGQVTSAPVVLDSISQGFGGGRALLTALLGPLQEARDKASTGASDVAQQQRSVDVQLGVVNAQSKSQQSTLDRKETESEAADLSGPLGKGIDELSSLIQHGKTTEAAAQDAKAQLAQLMVESHNLQANSQALGVLTASLTALASAVQNTANDIDLISDDLASDTASSARAASTTSPAVFTLYVRALLTKVQALQVAVS
ncbi:hypothetical protein ACIQUL_29530 [Streptomyces sp. NPDC090303]|uniref:hypothetical protein n=1 Tax=Streptomyces sp. NPDC090303 TaxID=3365960 RepID=UPI003802F360